MPVFPCLEWRPPEGGFARSELTPRHRVSASPRQTLAGWVLRTHELGVGKIGPYEGSSGHVGP